MEFESFRVQHVPREHNTDQDIYSLKTSTHPNKSKLNMIIAKNIFHFFKRNIQVHGHKKF